MSERNQQAVQFLRGLQIKPSVLGGFDKTATFEKFKELSELYEGVITEERKTSARAMSDYDGKLGELQRQLKLAEDNAAKTADETSSLRRRLAAMQAKADEAESKLAQARDEGSAKSRELQRLKQDVESAQAELKRLRDNPEANEQYLHQTAKYAAQIAELAAQKAENATLIRQKREVESELVGMKDRVKNALGELRKLKNREGQILNLIDNLDVSSKDKKP